MKLEIESIVRNLLDELALGVHGRLDLPSPFLPTGANAMVIAESTHDISVDYFGCKKCAVARQTASGYPKSKVVAREFHATNTDALRCAEQADFGHERVECSVRRS
jgi:hypothetical protein